MASPNNTGSCGIDAVPGTNPSQAEWNGIFTAVSAGPAAWGAAGPVIADIPQGCNKPQAPRDVPAKVPIEILKAVVMERTAWTQFCVPDSPADQIGGPARTYISFDCGYGAGVISTGMRINEAPPFDRQRVANDPMYNVATLAKLLAEKWRTVTCVGDRQPSIIEHWYSTLWAFDGLVVANNPNNPSYASDRGVWDPATSSRAAAPFQERIFGWIAHGPAGAWTSIDLAYPDPAKLGTGASPPDLPEPSCGSPANCTTTRTVHVSATYASSNDGGTDGGLADAGASDDASDASLPDTAMDAAQPPDDARLEAADAVSDVTADSRSSRESSAQGEGGCGCRLMPQPTAQSRWLLPLITAAAWRLKRRHRAR